MGTSSVRRSEVGLEMTESTAMMTSAAVATTTSSSSSDSAANGAGGAAAAAFSAEIRSSDSAAAAAAAADPSTDGEAEDSPLRASGGSSSDGGVSSVRRADPPPPPRRRIGTVALAVVVFYSVSGGPFGVEPSVRSGGFLPSLLGFAIAPLVWSVPEALMTAELGSAFPEPSGGVAWVEEAFGGGAGFAMGYATWVAGATDNAIYPALFLDYVLQAASSSPGDGDGGGGGSGDGEGEGDGDGDGDGGGDGGGGYLGGMGRAARFALLAATSAALAAVNYAGLDVVGNMSLVICVVSLSPFVLLTVLGLPKVDIGRLTQMPSGDADLDVDDDGGGLGSNGWLPLPNLGGVLWRPFLNNLFWNLNSFDSAANFAGEVEDPGVVFPRAMFASLFLVVMSYFIPLLVAVGASRGSRSEWDDGYLAKVCGDVVGPWLEDWTVFAAGISNVALFLSEMSSDAFQIMGMAERGLLPKVLATKSRYGTPTYGILIGTAVIVIMSLSDFSALVEILNFNYGVALLMEYAAFVWLRVSRGDVPRPYRIPLGTAGCVLFIVPPVAMILFVMMLATYTTYLYGLASFALGIAIYNMRHCGGGGRHRCCEYSAIAEAGGADVAGVELEPSLTRTLV